VYARVRVLIKQEKASKQTICSDKIRLLVIFCITSFYINSNWVWTILHFLYWEKHCFGIIYNFISQTHRRIEA